MASVAQTNQAAGAHYNFWTPIERRDCRLRSKLGRWVEELRFQRWPHNLVLIVNFSLNIQLYLSWIENNFGKDWVDLSLFCCCILRLEEQLLRWPNTGRRSTSEGWPNLGEGIQNRLWWAHLRSFSNTHSDFGSLSAIKFQSQRQTTLHTIHH